MHLHSSLILVVGGDLGRRSGMLLQEQGCKVLGLRRRPPAEGPQGLRWIAASATDSAALRALPSGISHVLYAPAPGERSEAAYRAVFIDGPARLLDNLDAAALRRFLFVSSSAVYGPSTDWVDEDTPPRPATAGGRILLDAEHRLRERLPGRSVAFRLSGLYGPGRDKLMRRLRLGQAAVPASGTHWVNRFHIEDAARACAHLLLLPDALPCYLGTDGKPYPMARLYDALAAMQGAPAPTRDPDGKPEAGKRLSPSRLLASGYRIKWPDAMEGYRALSSARCCSTATAGKVLPSRNSRKAPPPVEM